MTQPRSARKPALHDTRIRALSAVCAFVLLVGCDVMPVGASDETPEVASRDVIAILDETAPRATLLAAATARGYRLVSTTQLASIDKVLLTFETPPNETGAAAIAYLEAADPAATVGVNHAYRSQMVDTSVDPRTYAQTLMDWPTQACRARASVGLIDTMVDSSAPGLATSRVISRSFVGADASPARHGTEVASVLADPARISGLTIHNAAVMAPGPDGSVIAGADALIRALDWMVGQDVDVVNMSLAGPSNKILSIAVDAVAARGLIMVASVGNFGAGAGPFYPAAYEPVIAVTAVDADARVYRNAVRGAFVDVAAPGVDIFVPNDDGGRFVTGTSFAAAFVTSRMAADARMSGKENPTQVRALLAEASDDLGPVGFDRTYGIGLLKGPQTCD